MSELPIWHYLSKPLDICVTPINKPDCGKILGEQCIVYWQSNCQISVEFTNANNSYSDFCEVILKREVSSIKQPFVYS